VLLLVASGLVCDFLATLGLLVAGFLAVVAIARKALSDLPSNTKRWVLNTGVPPTAGLVVYDLARKKNENQRFIPRLLIAIQITPTCPMSHSNPKCAWKAHMNPLWL
jgi:hypothetical protein